MSHLGYLDYQQSKERADRRFRHQSRNLGHRHRPKMRTNSIDALAFHAKRGWPPRKSATHRSDPSRPHLSPGRAFSSCFSSWSRRPMRCCWSSCPMAMSRRQLACRSWLLWERRTCGHHCLPIDCKRCRIALLSKLKSILDNIININRLNSIININWSHNNFHPNNLVK